MKLVKNPRKFSVGDLLVDEDGVYKIEHIYANSELKLTCIFDLSTFFITFDELYSNYKYHSGYDTVYTDCDLTELLLHLEKEKIKDA